MRLPALLAEMEITSSGLDPAGSVSEVKSIRMRQRIFPHTLSRDCLDTHDWSSIRVIRLAQSKVASEESSGSLKLLAESLRVLKTVWSVNVLTTHEAAVKPYDVFP